MVPKTKTAIGSHGAHRFIVGTPYSREGIGPVGFLAVLFKIDATIGLPSVVIGSRETNNVLPLAPKLTASVLRCADIGGLDLVMRKPQTTMSPHAAQ